MLRRTSSLIFSVMAVTLTVASAAWACTVLVGSTQTTTPTGVRGENTVDATGEVDNLIEDITDCPDGEAEYCDYGLIIVNPDDVGAAPVGGSPSCHYDKDQYGISDDNPTVVSQTDAALVLQTENGLVPTKERAGDPMGTGETVMCYVSLDNENNAGDGPQTATQPAPFVITG